jgi:hypothetical protein
MKEIIWLASGIVIGILLAWGGFIALGVTFALADHAAWRNDNEPQNQLKP